MPMVVGRSHFAVLFVEELVMPETEFVDLADVLDQSREPSVAKKLIQG